MIALASDHVAIPLKEEIKKLLDDMGLAYRDFGTNTPERTDYPIYAARAARAVVSGECDRGIILCGTGIGISIAANKVPSIRCALCGDCFSAKATRLHNNANVLALGALVTGPGLALEIVDIFLDTPFSEEERHSRRVSQLEEE